jgi:hypothetical protein
VFALVASKLMIIFYGAPRHHAPGDRMVLATALVLPVVFAFAGLSAALVGWQPACGGRCTQGGHRHRISYSSSLIRVATGRAPVDHGCGMPLSKDDWGGIGTWWRSALPAAIAMLAMAQGRRRQPRRSAPCPVARFQRTGDRGDEVHGDRRGGAISFETAHPPPMAEWRADEVQGHQTAKPRPSTRDRRRCHSVKNTMSNGPSRCRRGACVER